MYRYFVKQIQFAFNLIIDQHIIYCIILIINANYSILAHTHITFDTFQPIC